MEPEILVPISEGQRLLGGISRTKLYDILSDLQTVKVGKRRMIIRASLDDYVAKIAFPHE
ncbi:MAG: hypothetical protein CMM22_00410 [Rhodospirillaceae bacterium]|jgi:hypothetical protein|nr:hypothetical protein [Rhodospirillaceae bacterium]|tara:strand:- start:1553 stop:1732 length:180 start_codon:yes stop_codon:yes gene_type:complete